jgi:hypothetical protein
MRPTTPTHVLCGFVVGVSACLPTVAFECTDASQCSRMRDGQCAQGNCTYPDDACASGRRYSDYADPSLAGTCVADGDEGAASSSTADSGSSGGPIPSDWWDCAWKHRARIVFGGAPGPALVDFTVLVTLDHTTLPGAFAENGVDLRFVDGDTVLVHEIERFDPTGTSLVWVRVPEVRTGEDDGMMLYWDNPAAMPLPDESAWDDRHVGVWHLGDDVNDSTIVGANGSDDSDGPTPAVIGDGRRFTPGGANINVGSASPLDDLFAEGGTVLAWVRADALGGAGFSRIAGKSLTDPGHTGWKLYLVDDPEEASEPDHSIGFQRDGEFNPAAWSGPTDALAGDGQWRFVALTFCDDLDVCGSICADDCGSDDCTPDAGVRPRFFIDGDPVLTIETRSLGFPAISDASDQLVLGRGPDGTEGLDGALDEVRVARTVRCDSWMRAEYLSTTGALAQLGAAEACPG